MALIAFGLKSANCHGATWTASGFLCHADGKKMVIRFDDARKLVAEFPALNGSTPPGMGRPATYDEARVAMASLANAA